MLATAERLSSHRLIDRLIRGRAWLVLITSALIGVVTLQLALLKLNGGVGHTLAAQAQLQRENATLSIENSELAAADRVQTRAAQLGMEFASSTVLRSLAANPRQDISRATSVLSAPVRPQTPSSEEVSGHGGEAGEAGEAGQAPQSGESTSSSAQTASTAEGKAAGEAKPEGSSSEGGSSQTSSGSGGGEASSASQTEAGESQSASGSAGGQGAPESSSGG